MTKKQLCFILLIFIAFEIGYSFVKHLGQPLDGDMAWNVIPAADVKPIFDSPFGTAAILHHKTYANPNRFFCHWVYKSYLLAAPSVLQKFVSPIESVYLACALSKIVIQMVLILILSMIISKSRKIANVDFLLAATLIFPLFQINGYRGHMGIIDPSTTYTFFYALPCVVLLIYFMPLILPPQALKRRFYAWIIYLLWLPLACVVALSGPLNPGVVLIVALLLVTQSIQKAFKHGVHPVGVNKLLTVVRSMPQAYWMYVIPVSLLSLYSLYLGTYNSITIESQIPLSDMYQRIPEGIYYQFTQDLGFPVLFASITINMIVIKRCVPGVEGANIMNSLKWLGIFSLLYILLLPLGGYREYRHNILRYDTIMPITLGLFIVFGTSTLYLLKTRSRKLQYRYIPFVLLVLVIYSNADRFKDKNSCEKNALVQIATSQDAVVQLNSDCPVLTWESVIHPSDTELNAQLLHTWGITTRKKLYCNNPAK
jgi:hypothetical protein